MNQEVQEKNGKSNVIKLGFEDLTKRYENRTAVFRIQCTFATECVGGQPADEEGIRQFIIHHLKVTDPEAVEAALRRIQSEELEDVTPEGGEVKEEKVYGVRALRRDKYGVFLGDWMCKACFKVGMSRLGVFTEKKGSKGDVSEVGQVRAWGFSALNPDKPNQIYCVAPDGVSAPETYHKDFMGRVSTPSGPVSIIHKSECLAPGTRFAFEFRFLQNFLTQDDIADVIAFMMTIGLGSARSMERGKFRVDEAEIEMGDAKKRGGDKKSKKEESDGEDNKAKNS